MTSNQRVLEKAVNNKQGIMGVLGLGQDDDVM